MGPVWRYHRIRYGPRDVPYQLLIDGIVGEAVGEIHGHVRQEGRHGELRPHAAVRESLLGTRVVLDDVPSTHHLQRRLS